MPGLLQGFDLRMPRAIPAAIRNKARKRENPGVSMAVCLLSRPPKALRGYAGARTFGSLAPFEREYPGSSRYEARSGRLRDKESGC